MPDRRAVELAVEHLVQDYGLDRSKVEIMPVGEDNTAGEDFAGADVESGYPGLEPGAEGAAVNGALLMSVELDEDQLVSAEKAFRDAGAAEVKQAGAK